jgi:O-antigen/teichoic acid export membrane protein
LPLLRFASLPADPEVMVVDEARHQSGSGDCSSTDHMTHKKPGHFETTHLHFDLRGHTVRGGKATVAAQAISFLLNIASVVILARLLSPADFGLIAMVTAVTGIVTIFKDGGLSIATIQRDTISHEQVSNLFWINVALTFLLMLLIAGLAPAIASFYGETRLRDISLAIAAIFFLGGLAVQHQALLRRQMRFGDLAKIQIASGALSLTTAIAAAVAGAGYWALLVQMATSETVSLLLTWWYCRWLPGRPQRSEGTRSMVNFGGYMTGLGLFSYLGRNADNVLVGNYLGSQAVGLYSKAYSLLLLPIQQINGPIAAVAMPALSRLQDQPEEYKKLFRKILSLIYFISFPLIVWMIVCREEIILIVLGPQWLEAVPIFLILAISALCQPIGNVSGLLFVTLGRNKRMLAWGVAGNLWLVTGIVVGLPYGVLGVAFGYAVATVLMMIPLMKFSIAGTFVAMSDYLEPMKVPALAVAVSGGLAWGMHDVLLTESHPWARLMTASSLMALVYLVVVHRARPQLLLGVRDIFLKRA